MRRRGGKISADLSLIVFLKNTIKKKLNFMFLKIKRKITTWTVQIHYNPKNRTTRRKDEST